MKTKELKQELEKIFNVRFKYNKIIINDKNILKIIIGTWNASDKLLITTPKVTTSIDTTKITTISFAQSTNMLMINGAMAIQYD